MFLLFWLVAPREEGCVHLAHPGGATLNMRRHENLHGAEMTTQISATSRLLDFDLKRD